VSSPSQSAGGAISSWRLALVLLLMAAGCSERSAPEVERELAVGVRRLFPTDAQPGHSWTDCMSASPLAIESQGERFVLVAAGEMLSAIDPETGAARWEIAIPAPDDQRAWIVATPALAGTKLVVVYQRIALNKRQRFSHHALVIDLEARALDPSFPELAIYATRPSFDGEDVDFSAANAVSRAALVHAPLPGRELGLVYVAFGNSQDIQPWHGWVFELDLEAWRGARTEDDPAAAAISGVLLTTPEHDCGKSGKSGSREMLCGAGVWSPAGPKLYASEGGFELLVPTGNGILDLNRRDYAHALLRLRRGLEFDPRCEMARCQDFDPRDPQHDCIESCRDLFIPRIPAGAPPLQPETGACDGMSLFECYAALDYDLGANSPARLTLASGRAVYLLPAKDGAVYLIDGEHMGKLHDRLQLAEPCGAADDPCRIDWAGMMVTEPLLVDVAGEKLALFSTFEADHTHPAGIYALRVEEDAQGVRLVRVWQAPGYDDPLAIQVFRQHPSRMAALQVGGQSYAFVVDVYQGQRGRLLGVRAQDGAFVVSEELRGPGIRFAQPLALDDRLYVASCSADSGPGQIEAFELTAAPDPAR
jgi:hypothetical protein